MTDYDALAAGWIQETAVEVAALDEVATVSALAGVEGRTVTATDPLQRLAACALALALRAHQRGAGAEDIARILDVFTTSVVDLEGEQ